MHQQYCYYYNILTSLSHSLTELSSHINNYHTLNHYFDDVIPKEHHLSISISLPRDVILTNLFDLCFSFLLYFFLSVLFPYSLLSLSLLWKFKLNVSKRLMDFNLKCFLVELLNSISTCYAFFYQKKKKKNERKKEHFFVKS